jgi:hypothetical protein
MREIIDRILELESKIPPYRLVYEHHIAGLVIGIDEIDVSRRNAEFISEVRNNIKSLLLRMKVLEDILETAIAMDKEVTTIDTVRHPNHYRLHVLLRQFDESESCAK